MVKQIELRSIRTGKKYHVYIGKNGHIAIDRNDINMLDKSKLKGYEEKIFTILDTLKDRDSRISELKHKLGIDIYNEFNLSYSDFLRWNRTGSRLTDSEIRDSNSGRLTLTIDRESYTHIINKLEDLDKVNTIGRLVLKTFGSLLQLIIKSVNRFAFDSKYYVKLNRSFSITINLISNSMTPSIESFSYPFSSLYGSNPFYVYVFNINRLWYYNIHLKNKSILKVNDRRFIVLKIDDNEQHLDYYVINNSSGYGLGVKKIRIKKNGVWHGKENKRENNG
ncbi:MAG: hypothetical protein QXD03_05070 [Candidatus Anstonellales archaeon]